MTLYLRERRKCETCEYFKGSDALWVDDLCCFDPPTIAKENTRPKTDPDDLCSKWEPKWHKNEQIREAWNEFMLVHKLITSGEDK